MLQAIHRGPELRVMPTREGGCAAPRLAAPLSRRYLGGDRPVAVFCMNLVTTTTPWGLTSKHLVYHQHHHMHTTLHCELRPHRW